MNGTSSRRTQIVRRSRPLRAPRGLFETDANVEGVAARYAAASAWRWLAQIEPAPARGSPLSKADDCGALVAGQVSSRDRSRVLGMARLEDYSFGRIVVDGEEQTRDLIVLPHRVLTNWWRREGLGRPPPAARRDRGAGAAGDRRRGAPDRRRGSPLRRP